MIRTAAASLIGFAALIGVSTVPASADRAVSCSSKDGHYRECRADFRSPVIVQQKSKSACIRNRSWGYDRDSGVIWVDRGCRAVFAEGARGGFRRGDRDYDRRYVDPQDDGSYGRRHRRDRQQDDCSYDDDC